MRSGVSDVLPMTDGVADGDEEGDVATACLGERFFAPGRSRREQACSRVRLEACALDHPDRDLDAEVTLVLGPHAADRCFTRSVALAGRNQSDQRTVSVNYHWPGTTRSEEH